MEFSPPHQGVGELGFEGNLNASRDPSSADWRSRGSERESDREIFHNTDSRAQLHFSLTTPSPEGLDELNAALRSAISKNSLLAPAFGAMMVNFTPQNDWVRVNAAYG